jgi:hypothetical protein
MPATGAGQFKNTNLGQSTSVVGSASAPTTTSATYVDLTDMSVTLTTRGGDLVVLFCGAFAHSGVGNSITVGLSLDAAAEVADMPINEMVANLGFNTATTFRFPAPAAGSHTIKARWKTNGATATALATARYMIVTEVAG